MDTDSRGYPRNGGGLCPASELLGCGDFMDSFAPWDCADMPKRAETECTLTRNFMRPFICRLLLVPFVCGVVTGEAATLRVPTQYTNIQAAINSAATGDVVLVARGIYFENISFLGKGITVVSESGPENTVLDGRRAGAVVSFMSHETRSSVLSGFTIRNGYEDFGSGVNMGDASATIVGNIFENNEMVFGTWGAAIGGNSGSPVIEKNIFRHNWTDDNLLSGVITFVNESSPRIANNLFYDNPGRALSMVLNYGASPVVINNTIVRNHAGIRVDGRAAPFRLSFYNNIVSGNLVGLQIEYEPPIVWLNNLLGGNGTDYIGLPNQAGTNGNISGVPAFQCGHPSTAIEFRLSPGSLGVDAGDNSAPQLPADDFEGHPRILAGQSNGLPVADMGAFEFDPSAPLCMCSGPHITLIGSDRITNECHTVFVDPGARAIGLPPAPPLAISAGAYHSLALRTNGTVVGWGHSEFGEANPPASATNVVAISAGGYQSLALRADHSVIFWGLHGGGNVVPESETDIAAIAAGYGFSLVLRTNGTVAGWGDFNSGALLPATIPENVTNVVAIAAGYAHALVLKADGTVLGWGDNTYHQTTIPASATNVVAISAGAAHSLALKADGTIIAWGTNNFGRLDVPADATNIIAISAGGLHSLALRADGYVFAWGWDAAGQTDIPPEATNVVEISAGYYDCLAKLASGLVIGWGGNYYGQRTIPDEINTNYLPVTVSGSVNADAPGNYTLTYTATNNLGDVGMATRTVVVVDTTPPTVICPPHTNVDLTSTAGTTVFFSAQAMDLCAGQVSVTSVPPSGSLFPVGTNTVVCSAVDGSGNGAQCSFTIVVRGLLTTKETVLAEMYAVNGTQSRRNPMLEKAIANLTRSIKEGLWQDDLHLTPKKGGEVFAAESQAVLALSLLVRDRRVIVPKDVAQEWIVRLVRVDRLLAELEIEAARDAGASPKQLASSLDRLARGDQASGRQMPALAILYYEQAWKKASGLAIP